MARTTTPMKQISTKSATRAPVAIAEEMATPTLTAGGLKLLGRAREIIVQLDDTLRGAGSPTRAPSRSKSTRASR